MTVTESVLPLVPTLRGWFGSACQRFAPNPPTRRSAVQRDGLAPLRNAADATTSMTAAGSSPGQSRAGPDPRRSVAETEIAPEDWDLLFRAALDLLARVSLEKASLDGKGTRLQAPGTALLECLNGLDQLRRAVPTHGTQPVSKSAPTESASGFKPPPAAPGGTGG